MNKTMTECPRFKFCSSNVCPLDDLSHLRTQLDGEEKCKVAKSIRLSIGTKYELPRLGLKNYEWAARQRFENMSQEEKEKFISEGSERLKTVNHRSSQTVTPKDEPSIHPKTSERVFKRNLFIGLAGEEKYKLGEVYN